MYRSCSWIVTAAVAISTLCILPGTVQAQKFKILHSFTGASDGVFPEATVTFDSSGNLYGTTFGTIYEIDSSGSFTTLHSFSKHEGTESYSTLLRDTSGNLYGTNSQGGMSNLGTLFRLSPSGRLVVLVNWGALGMGTFDGMEPLGGLISDQQGNLYGSTQYGGADDAGTVYKVDHRTGDLTLLHSFANTPDGCAPNGKVLLSSDGNLYGATECGGTFGWGILYKMDLSGNETILYNFSNGDDGGSPNGSLIEDADGSLYGTTYQGGTVNVGTIFKFDPSSGVLTTLYNFGTQTEDGGDNPFAGVVMDRSGNLYGTSYNGNNAYKLTPDGAFTNLHVFTGVDGYLPYAGVTLYKGSIYGTTQQGGVYGAGVVYKITP